MSGAHFTVPRPEQWSKLPLKLRQRWWRETDYGRVYPNDALIKAIQEAADAPCEPTDRATDAKDKRS